MLHDASKEGGEGRVGLGIAIVAMLLLFNLSFALIQLEKPVEYEEKITYVDEERINFTEINITVLTLIPTKTGVKNVQEIDRWETKLIPIEGVFPDDMPEEAKFNRMKVPVFKTVSRDVYSTTTKYVQTSTIIGIAYIVKVPRYELVEKKLVGAVK